MRPTRMIFTSTSDVAARLTRPDVEIALLAGLMARNGAIPEIGEILKAEHFADALHGRLFDAILSRYRDGTVVNTITLIQQFDIDPEFVSRPGSAAHWLSEVAAGVVTLINLSDYASEIRSLWERRCMAAIADAVLSDVRDVELPTSGIASTAITSFTDVIVQGRGAMTGSRDNVEEITAMLKNPLPCFTTGLPTMDESLGGGLFAGQLYGFGARKKTGKTILATTISDNVTQAGTPHLFITAEMAPTQIEMKKIARFMNINPMAFLKRPVPKSLLEGLAQYHASVNPCCWYEHKPGIHLEDLLHVIARYQVRYGIKGFIFDYLQLVQGRARDETEAQHSGVVAQRLADLCRHLGIWGVVMAQLNQDGNTRGGEGLRLAADLYYVIHRGKDERGGWLEMQEARYVPYRSIGNEGLPGVWLHDGAYFSEDPPTEKQIAAMEEQ